jgi:hypothetical protein
MGGRTLLWALRHAQKNAMCSHVKHRDTAVQIANRMPRVHDFQVCPQTIRRMPDSRCKPLFWLPNN